MLGLELGDLPLLNAVLNGCSGLLLVCGLVFVRCGWRVAHRRCMVGALLVSGCFLVGYVVYHVGMRLVYGEAHTVFREPGWFRPFYLVVLVSHVVLAVVAGPLVLVAVWRAVRGDFVGHVRWARWAWPVWFYVSVSGVVVYLVLYRIFPQG